MPRPEKLKPLPLTTDYRQGKVTQRAIILANKMHDDHTAWLKSDETVKKVGDALYPNLISNSVETDERIARAILNDLAGE